MSGELGDALESDFYWIDSIDRLTNDAGVNSHTFEASTGFQSVYERDRQEWIDDTWEYYRSYSRNVWNGFVEGFEREFDSEVDWVEIAPRVIFNGNGGRLIVDCPGTMIGGIRTRSATQADYAEACGIQQ